MTAPRKRRWARWVTLTLEYRLRDLCRMARAHGLQIIDARRPGLCAWEGLALFGTPAQIHALEAQWTEQQLRWRPRRPPGAWDVGRHRPRDQWAETTVDWTPDPETHPGGEKPNG